MLTRRNLVTLMLAAATIAIGGAPGLAQPADKDPKAKPDKAPLTIAIIPKGTTHVFWKTVEQGAKKAGEDLGVKVIWKGPLMSNDGKEVLAKDAVADDKFLGGINFYVKCVEGKVPGGDKK